jgi:hypothetical protein
MKGTVCFDDVLRILRGCFALDSLVSVNFFVDEPNVEYDNHPASRYLSKSRELQLIVSRKEGHTERLCLFCV